MCLAKPPSLRTRGTLCHGRAAVPGPACIQSKRPRAANTRFPREAQLLLSYCSLQVDTSLTMTLQLGSDQTETTRAQTWGGSTPAFSPRILKALTERMREALCVRLVQQVTHAVLQRESAQSWRCHLIRGKQGSHEAGWSSQWSSRRKALEAQEQTINRRPWPFVFVGRKEKRQGSRGSPTGTFPTTQQTPLIPTPPFSRAESSSPRKEILKLVQTSLP